MMHLSMVMMMIMLTNWLLLLMTFMLMKLLNILIHVMEEVQLEEFVIQEHLLSQPT
ncbi:Uncharacterised protein [Mycobacterium tuberculosis]|nr:Uncharacterised protein [Streptococcus pneumoniae]CKU06884.1 Uncharacterised protein [Mycobacterium tuberculosis]CKV80853.1 Uncharacterised protein [Mycobacterium tuberculosis]